LPKVLRKLLQLFKFTNPSFSPFLSFEYLGVESPLFIFRERKKTLMYQQAVRTTGGQQNSVIQENYFVKLEIRGEDL
jgi:hypothetical protein